MDRKPLTSADFDFIAIHRPYVFHRKRSRTEALHASIRMLDSQLESFRGLDPKTWRNFLLFFGSFDAVVLMASIFIFFPRENADLAPKALIEFQETQARFGTSSPVVPGWQALLPTANVSNHHPSRHA